MKRGRDSHKGGVAGIKRARQADRDARDFKGSTFAEAAIAAAGPSLAPSPAGAKSSFSESQTPSSRRAKKHRNAGGGGDDGWDEEQEYERVSRVPKVKKESLRLPVRDAEKERWSQVEATSEIKDDGVVDEDENTDDEDEEMENQVQAQPAEQQSKPAKPQLSPKQQIIQAKEQLAKIATLLNENPEENIGGLKDLQELADSENYKIRQLALMTQLAVYKDIIPGYRIRPLSEDDAGGKVSKEIKQLREYEQRLVAGYKKYVDTLTSLTRSRTSHKTTETNGHTSNDTDSKAAKALCSVAVTCACSLLVSVPHFNFRSDLINILARKLSVRHRNADFDRSVTAFEQLFREDEDGYASTEAVATLAKMIKARNLSVHENALNVFLQLRLLSEFSRKGSAARIDKPGEGGEGAEGSAIAEKINQKQYGRKVKRQQREFRTKRERKHMREMKELEAEMAEADATVSHEDRERMQAESLKLVFGVYFRVLKARVRHLMGAVLEGLARYAHLINQDFFGDIIEALRELVAEREAEAAAASGAGVGDEDDEGDLDDNGEDDVAYGGSARTRDAAREALLCAITAFALLNGQQGVSSSTSSALGLDLSFFVGHLYRTLLPLSMDPDIDLSYRRVDSVTAALTSAESTTTSTVSNRVNFQTTIVLLIRSLSSTLLPTHQALRSVPPIRLAAFCKRLLTLSIQLPEKSAIAVLGLVNQVVKVHGKRIAGMWYSEERRADGIFDPLRPDLEASNPFATTVWEGEILRLHYCPHVRRAGKEIEKGVVAHARR